MVETKTRQTAEHTMKFMWFYTAYYCRNNPNLPSRVCSKHKRADWCTSWILLTTEVSTSCSIFCLSSWFWCSHLSLWSWCEPLWGSAFQILLCNDNVRHFKLCEHKHAKPAETEIYARESIHTPILSESNPKNCPQSSTCHWIKQASRASLSTWRNPSMCQKLL